LGSGGINVPAEYKIAEAYILYQPERAKLRKLSNVENKYETTEEQESIIVGKNADDDSFLWDGSELCKRVAFANASLHSHPTFHKNIFISKGQDFVGN
jgi:hypothetical protein